MHSFSKPTPFPFFWGHDSNRVTSLRQKPNAYLRPLGKAKQGRPLRRTEQLWPLALRLLITERARLNTYRVSSVVVNQPVLSNVWWEITFQNCRHDKALLEKSLCVWFNSSLGLISILSAREQTQGAFVALKKLHLKRLLVPDFNSLDTVSIEQLASSFDKLADSPLEPFSNMEKDEIRIKIDKAVSDAFGLPDLAPIRTLLANEPIVTLNPLYEGE